MKRRELDAALAECLGWKRIGDDDHTSPLHDPGRGTVWDSKGPHPRLEAPDGSGAFYLCDCQHDKGIDLPPFLTAPTWETSGQLIEGLAAKGWRFHMDWEQGSAHAAFHVRASDGCSLVASGDAATFPAAVAEAAKWALVLEPEDWRES